MDFETFQDVREKVSPSRLSRPALIGIAVIVVMVAVVAGRNILDTATASEFALERTSSSVQSASATSAGEGGGGLPGGSGQPGVGAGTGATGSSADGGGAGATGGPSGEAAGTGATGGTPDGAGTGAAGGSAGSGSSNASGAGAGGATDPADATAAVVSGTAKGPGGDAEASKTIFVHVSGCVATPGLYELPSDSRVGDALDAAGGIGEEGALDSVNLARPLSDGEKVIVATQEEYERAREEGRDLGNAAGADGLGHQSDLGEAGAVDGEPAEPGASEGAAGDGGGVGALVNVNEASASELESLPGIGPSTAQKIVAEREANGPFQSPDDLTRVSGIGEKKLEAMRDFVCV